MPLNRSFSYGYTFLWLNLLTLLGGCSQNSAPVTQHVDATCPVDLIVAGVDTEVQSKLLQLQRSTDIQNPQALGSLAMAYEMNGFPNAGMQCYAHAQQLDKQNPAWPYYQALLYAAKGNSELAIAYVDQALQLEGDNAVSWLWKGYWSLDSNQLVDAETSFRRAAELGEQENALVGLALVQLAADEPQKAIDTLQPIADPSLHPYVAELLGRAYWRLGNDANAQSYLKQSKGTGRPGWHDPRSLIKQDYAYSISTQLNQLRKELALGHTEDSVQELETLHATYPFHRGVLLTTIEANRLMGKQSRVYELLQTSLQTHPRFGLLHKLMAEHYLAVDNQERAMPHLQRSIELGEQSAWIHAQLGLLLLDEDRPNDALKHFLEAVQLDPLVPQPSYYTGMVLHSLQRHTEAVEYLERAIEIDPNFVVGYIDLSSVLIQLGEYTRTAELLEQAIALGGITKEIESMLKTLQTQQKQ